MSPRKWGCTVRVSEDLNEAFNVPTQVGVYRNVIPNTMAKIKCPHASGGVPLSFKEFNNLDEMSPRKWGCTENLIGFVFKVTMSPRKWGCTGPLINNITECVNVPTQVGVYHFASILEGG